MRLNPGWFMELMLLEFCKTCSTKLHHKEAWFTCLKPCPETGKTNSKESPVFQKQAVLTVFSDPSHKLDKVTPLINVLKWVRLLLCFWLPFCVLGFTFVWCFLVLVKLLFPSQLHEVQDTHLKENVHFCSAFQIVSSSVRSAFCCFFSFGHV